MELIIIDESRLKIMLTPTDMRHYDLPSTEMTTAGASTRRAFRHIFDDARAQVGFDTTGERLFVQLYTSRGGGCEIFVTKLGSREETDDLFAPEDDLDELLALDDPSPAEFMHDGERSLLKQLWKEAAMEHSEPSMVRLSAPFDETDAVAYRFDDAETLFALCRRLDSVGFSGESAVYIVERTPKCDWYLWLKPVAGDRLPPFLPEYAPQMEDTDTIRLWLAEHGREICTSRATEIMGRI